ncbi:MULTISPECIES: iron chaperone [unclassified Paraflavitalea]|uniref:iron chaperone n=1 Tax=unclassified Paraflavitalea TaxID=2798305 RepID=UPI003D35238D
MKIEAGSVDEYIEKIAEPQQAAVKKLRAIVKKNLPKGFKEQISYNMIGFVVPHSTYPNGYHCDPKLPLPFLNIAAQKNFIALYNMGLYADPVLTKWFQEEYAKLGLAKLDMGKSCIRFKKPDQIPYDLIGELCKKISVDKWIEMYESAFRKK